MVLSLEDVKWLQENSGFVLDKWRIDTYSQDQYALQISQCSYTIWSRISYTVTHQLMLLLIRWYRTNDEYETIHQRCSC